MSWGSRVLVCCILIGCAGDHRLDPSELELRYVLGLAPEIAMTWDASQRAAARRVIDAGLHAAHAAPIHAALGREPALDRRIATALAAADAERENHRLPALGVVQLAVDHDELQATPRTSTLAPRGAPILLELAGWSDRPGWAALPARGLDMIATLARDAGHRSGPVIVTPAPQLAVIAGYVPATPTSRARLVVNPVLLAALEPGAATASPPAVVTADAIGNPYNFYTSVAECAAAQQTRCEACLPNASCTSLTATGDGTAECNQLEAEQPRGYSLVCINFALAIEEVASCTAASAPSCPQDPHAAESITSLDHNADFLDRADCASPLDQCLGEHAGSSPPSTGSPSSSTSCSDSASSCDGSSCDGGGDNSGDGCSSDSCDSCGSGDSGGDCSSGDSGGDCSGGGGDCSGDGGGDCSGGGGDCNAARTRRRGGHDGYLWACLPLPFAVIARRRAERRRARMKRAA